MEKYETPGERLQSKVPTEEYKGNYEKIFGRKQYWYEKQLELDFGEDGEKTEAPVQTD